MRTVKPKKSLGQHFLRDLRIAQDIADTADVRPDLPILEVGPGMGVLSQFLKQKNRPYKLVEIDTESVSYLHTAFPELRESVMEGDFLKMDLKELFGGAQFLLTGNYPYNISSQIFFKLLENMELIPCCTGMVQREVAQRICAVPGNKSWGILSVLLQTWYDTEYLFTVGESVFDPPPKVKSAVIRLTRNSRQELDCNPRLFKKIVKATFGQRRKMLRNSLKTAITGSDTPLPDTPYLTLRPEQLSVEDFIFLTNMVEAASGA